VVADPVREGGRTLVLDTLRHSYVDLADPTYLEFGYVQAVASVTDTLGRPGQPLSALHVGGGGLTVPRYLADVRPGTTSRVLEVDAGVLALDRAELGLQTSPDLQVDVGDARIGLRQEPAAARDLVVGDAFGGLAVPWQLTTVEALQLVDRALTDDGVYAVNLIDHGPLSFLRAELATMQQVFPYVALLARAPVVAGEDGGNVVAVASRSPIDTAAITAALAGRLLPWQVVTGTDLDAFVAGAPVLTDDFAPVDQLLTPYG
jgi:spermidine synthase